MTQKQELIEYNERDKYMKMWVEKNKSYLIVYWEKSVIYKIIIGYFLTLVVAAMFVILSFSDVTVIITLCVGLFLLTRLPDSFLNKIFFRWLLFSMKMSAKFKMVNKVFSNKSKKPKII